MKETVAPSTGWPLWVTLPETGTVPRELRDAQPTGAMAKPTSRDATSQGCKYFIAQDSLAVLLESKCGDVGLESDALAAVDCAQRAPDAKVLIRADAVVATVDRFG